MQSFTILSPSTTLESSLTPLLDNDQTALSCSAGTAFPTTNLLIGMLCYRSDTNKLYELTGTGPAVWTLLIDLNKTPVETDGSGNATITGLFTTGTLAAGASTFSGLLTASSASITGALGIGGLLTLSAAVNFAKAADIASAATVNIGAAAGNYLNITGTTGITAFDTVQAGTERIVNFTGALLLTHNATNLILPGAANITTGAGDRARFVSLGSGNWVCNAFLRANGQAVSAFGKEASIASASATDLGSTGSNQILITGTTGITGLGSSASLANPLYAIRFSGILTLTNDATALILPGGQNITTAAGDSALALYLGSGNWRFLSYLRGNGVALSATGAETSIASNTICDIGTAGSNVVKITGTTTIASFGSSAAQLNPIYFVRFASALILTYNATTMLLPGAANITAAAGDAGVWEYLGSGNWQCLTYQKANGASVVGAGTNVQSFASPGSFTWTKPAGTTSSSRVLVQEWAGGGGGGGDGNGAGGGGGAYIEKWYLASALGATEPVVVGGGGAGNNGSSAAGAGGNSTFSSTANLLTAYGGGGGTNQAGGGGGGSSGIPSTASGGTPGTGGLPNVGGFGGGNGNSSGNGTDSGFGGGGGGGSGVGNGGNSVHGGAGGGGGSGTGGASVFGGAGGASGVAGTAPGGGGGGTSGQPGGTNGKNGAAGQVIVTTFL